MIKAKPPSGVSLLYLHEQNVEEIVYGTGLSASNVKVKLHRSRRKLFEILNQHLKEEVWTPQKNERDADKLLRDLFNEAGQFTAPEGLDARILQRIAASPKIAISRSATGSSPAAMRSRPGSTGSHGSIGA